MFTCKGHQDSFKANGCRTDNQFFYFSPQERDEDKAAAANLTLNTIRKVTFLTDSRRTAREYAKREVLKSMIHRLVELVKLMTSG